MKSVLFRYEVQTERYPVTYSTSVFSVKVTRVHFLSGCGAVAVSYKELITTKKKKSKFV